MLNVQLLGNVQFFRSEESIPFVIPFGYREQKSVVRSFVPLCDPDFSPFVHSLMSIRSAPSSVVELVSFLPAGKAIIEYILTIHLSFLLKLFKNN